MVEFLCPNLDSLPCCLWSNMFDQAGSEIRFQVRRLLLLYIMRQREVSSS